MKKTALFATVSVLAGVMSAQAGGFYGAIKGGYGYLQNNLRQTTLEPLAGVIADGKEHDSVFDYKVAVGYDFGELAAEVEFSQYTQAKFNGDWTLQPEGPTCTNASCFMYNTFELNTDLMTLFANMSYAVDFGYAIKPFVTAGAGVAFVKETGSIHVGDYERTPVNDESFDMTAPSENHTEFAWNVGLGAEYDLSEEFSIHAMYRFVDVMEIDNSKPGADVKRDMDMHEFVIGVKYMF